MGIVQGIDGSMLLNALRQGREDRAAVDDRALQRMFQQRQMDQQDRIITREDKAQAKSDALDANYAAIFGTGGAASPAEPAMPTGAPASAAPGPSGLAAPAATPSPASATATPFSVNPDGLRKLAALGPTGLAAAQSIMKMNAEQLKAAQEAASRAADIKARAINAIRAYPPEQREAQYQAQKAELAQQGIDITHLAPHWDEGMADGLVQQSMTALEALGLKDKAATFAETVRHNKATEDAAQGSLAVAKGNLGVAQGHLAVSRDTLQAAKDGKIGVLPGNEDLAGYR